MSKHPLITYPFVLIHGIMNFDKVYSTLLGLDHHSLFDGVSYFRNIRSILKSTGYSVETAHVSFSGFLLIFFGILLLFKILFKKELAN
jgi:hypothetical protein